MTKKTIGKYQIGRYHSIIKKIYVDNSIDYETNFSSSADFYESFRAIKSFVGSLVGIYTENPRFLKDLVIISGMENIIKELER